MSDDHRPAIRLDETDTVVTLLEDADDGDPVAFEGPDPDLETAEAVPFGHKLAITPHKPGDVIRKYGEAIGVATEPIDRGEWVHTHNCDSRRGKASASVEDEVNTEVTSK